MEILLLGISENTNPNFLLIRNFWLKLKKNCENHTVSIFPIHFGTIHSSDAVLWLATLESNLDEKIMTAIYHINPWCTPTTIPAAGQFPNASREITALHRQPSFTSWSPSDNEQQTTKGSNECRMHDCRTRHTPGSKQIYQALCYNAFWSANLYYDTSKYNSCTLVAARVTFVS